MRIQNPILFILFIWFGIEFFAFALVVHEFGLSAAVLLGLATTFAGFSILRRIGLGAAMALRNSFQDGVLNKQIFSLGTIRNGSWAAFGAMLLILPGFVSDLIGFCLVTPAVRGLFSKVRLSPLSFTKDHPGTKHAVVELSRQEWSRVENPQQN